MKCPHCQEELGINNICINATCSYFGAEIYDSTISNHNINNNANTMNQDHHISSDKSNTSNSYNNSDQTNYNLQSTDTVPLDTSINHKNQENNHANKQNSNNNAYNQKSNYNNENSKSKVNYKSSIGPDINDISNEEFLAFFGDKNYEFYLRQTNTYRVNTNFTNWNWASFFLTFYWLLYRKLYGIAFGYLAIDILTSFLRPASLILRIVLGFYGNSIYLKIAEKKIRGIRQLNTNISREEYLMKIREQGGTNIIAPLAFILVSIIIIFIIGVFAFSSFSSSPEIHQGFYYY